jgi:hypothetical protein
MPKPYKVYSTRPLPPDAVVLDQRGRPHVRIKERGRAVLCPLTKDGTKYLKPSKCWYFDVPNANGKPKRTKGFSDLKATETLATEKARKAERLRSGFSDPSEDHVRRPLTEHLMDYVAHLTAKGGTGKHVRDTSARITSLLGG